MSLSHARASGACVDRSGEFAALVQQRAHFASPSPAPSTLGAGTLELSRQQQTVNALAAQIGQELFHTTQRLAELMRLAQSQSPFSEQGARVDELTHAVKGDLGRLQQALGVLEAHVSKAASKSGAASARQANEHASNVVKALTARLVDTTKGFAQALQTRTATLRQHEQRRARIGAAAPLALGVGSNMGMGVGMSSAAAAREDEERSELSVAIAVPTLRQQTQSRSLLVERAEQVRDIEAAIADVQGVFRKLAELVTVQGEQIARIEDNVMQTEVHATEAHRQLLHYLTAVSSDRWLAAKLFGVLLLFIFLFVLFFL